MDQAVIYKTFGRALAERRNEARKSQDELATLVGMSRASVANIEAGRQSVYLHHILAFAAALNVDDARELVPQALAYAKGDGDVARIDTKERLSTAERARANHIFNSVNI